MDLPDVAIVKEFIELEVIDSTNRYALDTGRPGLLVVSKEQTSGKGRRGRSWYSPKGTNLYMTLTTSIPDPKYSIVIGVAVHEVITDMLCRSNKKDDIIIKWPNDILIQGKKVCGILCESKRETTALGIGVNVNQDHWPDDISEKAVSLKEALGHPLEVRHVLHKILISLNKWLSIYQGDGFDPIRAAFLARSHIIGAAARTQEGRQCKIIGLDMEGHLLVEASGRIHNLLSGDIHMDVKNR